MPNIVQGITLASGDLLSVLPSNDTLVMDYNINYEYIERAIRNNTAAPRFRISVLHRDEDVFYEIPQEDIKKGGSYSENYQNGQRRTLSFSLYNNEGKYTPSMNNLWMGTRVRLDVGISIDKEKIVWFEKGIFVITSITPNITRNGSEVQISASDKFSIFESGVGVLQSTYEVPINTDIRGVITNIVLTQGGDGFPLDSKEILYDQKLKGIKTQAKITKQAGDTMASLLLELGTQLSAEIFYNSHGNLVVTPIDEVTLDKEKPCMFSFDSENGDIGDMSFQLDYSTMINRIVVIGTTNYGGTFQYEALNDNADSPMNYQRIGYRTGPVINDPNITSKRLAKERAEYELRKVSILKSVCSSDVLFNPLIQVNNVVRVSNEFFGLKAERFLVQGVSFSLDYTGTMNISFTNLNNLSFVLK